MSVRDQLAPPGELVNVAVGYELVLWAVVSAGAGLWVGWLLFGAGQVDLVAVMDLLFAGQVACSTQPPHFHEAALREQVGPGCQNSVSSQGLSSHIHPCLSPVGRPPGRH